MSIPPDGGATLVVDSADGGELRTDHQYVFPLWINTAGSQIAAYRPYLDDTNPTQLVDTMYLSTSVFDASGAVVRDAQGRRIVVDMQFGHVPLATGTFACGQPGVASIPGSLLTYSADAVLRDDANSTSTTIDSYKGYPIPQPPVGCTLTISALDSQTMAGTFSAQMFTYDSNDIAQVHGAFVLPTPRCTYAQVQASPQTCVPWAF